MNPDYRPDKYDMHRTVGVPYVYEQRHRPKRKKMFNFYESSFHTVQQTSLPKVPNRWISEISDNYVYYVTDQKSPNQPYRHNYDLFDPLRTTARKFDPQDSGNQTRPLEEVVPPRGVHRPQTAPVRSKYGEREQYVRRRDGSRRKNQRKVNSRSPVRRKSEEIDIEERRIRKGGEGGGDEGMPQRRKKVFTEAEDTKFHSNMTFEERENEKRNKALESLKRQAFDGVTNVKPTFVLPKGSRPEFCNYGHGNIKPLRNEDYMKTFNVKAGKLSELHDYITTRREKTHGYSEWRKYMGSTPQNFGETGAYKKKQLTRPKTPPRMHKAKQADYKGVTHYFRDSKGDIGEEVSPKKKAKPTRKRKKKQQSKKNRDMSPRKQAPQPQPQPKMRRNSPKVAPGRGNLRHYMEEELEEVMEHGSNVGRDDFSMDGVDDEDDEGEITTEKKLTRIVGGKIYAFEPKKFNNEDWNPKNYKNLPNEFTCFIRSAGVRTVRDGEKSVSQAMRQFN